MCFSMAVDPWSLHEGVNVISSEIGLICQSRTELKGKYNDFFLYFPKSWNQIPFAFDFALKMHIKEKNFQHSID